MRTGLFDEILFVVWLEVIVISLFAQPSNQDIPAIVGYRVWVLSRLFVVFASTLAVTRVSWGQPGFTASEISKRFEVNSLKRFSEEIRGEFSSTVLHHLAK